MVVLYKRLVPSPSLCISYYAIHLVLAGGVLGIIFMVFERTRSINLFSLHSVCMSIGGMLCIGEGIICYNNSFLVDLLSPIMQHGIKKKLRSINRNMHFLGIVFLFLGVLFAASGKVEVDDPLFSYSLHSILGAGAIFVLVTYHFATAETMSIPSLHDSRKYNAAVSEGALETEALLFIWDLMTLAFLSGVSQFFIEIIYRRICQFVLIPTVWFAVHYQMLPKTMCSSKSSFLKQGDEEEVYSDLSDSNSGINDSNDNSDDSDVAKYYRASVQYNTTIYCKAEEKCSDVSAPSV